MRISTRLLSNAFTTYLRLGTTFVLGLFTTWYILGAVGVIGFGLMALAISSTSPSRALERALRFGLVRELAAAIASGEEPRIRCSSSSALRLCVQASLPVMGMALVLAGLAWWGMFNTPADRPWLDMVLAVLVATEGAHAAARLVTAPFLQALFAAQRVAIDNLLQVLARLTYALSAVIVFGWLLRGESLEVQLLGFAVSRLTLQLADVVVGVWLARRYVPELSLSLSEGSEEEYRAVRGTVWHSSQVTLLLNINPQLVAILINLFFGLTYNTIWQIVVQFSGYARMFAEGVLRGIEPLTTHLQESGRRGATIELMTRSIRYQLGVVLPAALFLGVHVEALLGLWVGDRLAADPNLAAAGISAAEALSLTAQMAVVMLVMQALRAGFFGVERILYGMGHVRSYSWFSKWGTVICTGTATLGMAWLGEPLVAPFAVLLAHALFSPLMVLRGASRAAGLPVARALRRSLPGPLLANALFFLAQFLAAPHFARLDLPRLVALLAFAAAVYGPLALFVVTRADERARLRQMAAAGLRRIRNAVARRRGR